VLRPLLPRLLAACLCFLAACACARQPADSLPAIGDETLRALAAHPQWLRLLHATSNGRSEIHTPEFFLSPDGATDPHAELFATVQALSQAPGRAPEEHARCRFPARTLWLSQHLDLGPKALPHLSCPKLAAWAQVDRLRSISLLLVSGYFGNPASSFGHSLIRLNTEDGRASDGLTDLGVNFGALVPENEWAPVYVVRGLFGGYQAGFSDQPYYTHDRVYSRTEFRDIWDHELALDDHEQLLLVYHLWEIAGKKFTYFFLKQNCAYRMAELLALARDDDRLLARSRAWYAPVELFHRLHEAQRDGERPWIRAVRFIPSAERVVRHQFARLQPQEAFSAHRILEQAPDEPMRQLKDVEAGRRIDVLDALLAYQNYRIAAEEPEVSAATRTARQRELLARLRLPPRTGADSPVPALTSPSEGSPPLLAALGVGHDRERGDFMRLRATLFSYELSGHHALPNGELVVLDTTLHADAKGRVKLDRVDLIRAKKLNAMDTSIHGESRLSWQIALGAQRELADGRDRLRASATFGAGYATSCGTATTAYAIVNGLLLGAPSRAALEPQVGLVMHAGHWKTWTRLGARRESGTDRWAVRHRTEATYRITADRAVRMELSREPATRAVMSLLQYW
jgi:hypothetical protein